MRGEPPETPETAEPEAPRHLDEVLARLPDLPGVYLMKDRRGRIVYIGKAANLRQRVRSYFAPGSSDTRYFVPLLGNLLSDIETIVTNNEKEALLLENTLVKQHQPKFNVKLTDDKNFLVLRLDPRARYPRLEVGRRIQQDGAYYFGPYHSATAARETLRVVNRHFKLRTCTDHVLASRKRPCLQYQIKRCDAPCVFPIPEEEYAEDVRDVALFLQGKDTEVVARLGDRMREASRRTEYERAAAIRDQIAALNATLERQRVVSSVFVDQDAIGLYREGTEVELAVLYVRKGKLVGRQAYTLRQQELPDIELLSSFVDLHYDLATFVPDEVLLPIALDDAEVKAEWLRERRAQTGGSGKVEVLLPQRGPRAELVRLASKNAESNFRSRRDHEKDAVEALAKLQRRLRLPKLPKRIECYDIANLQGTSIVASMVVFEDGAPVKQAYRRFQIKTVSGEPDDFASIYEVLSRRFKRARDGEEGGGWALPDLIVIDGGRGQLGAALAAARDQGVDAGPQGLPIVGLAKEREIDGAAADQPAPERPDKKERRPERVFLPRIKDPIPLRESSAEVYLLAKLRDEAHRFANRYHQELRRKKTLRSSLSLAPGIGAKRQRELLKHFGSLKRVKEATLEELAAAPGMNAAAARALHAFLHGPAPEAPAADARPPQAEDEDLNAEGDLEDVAEEPLVEEAEAE